MLTEKTESHSIYDKTGWAKKATPKIGWYIGYIGTKDKTWFFSVDAGIDKTSYFLPGCHVFTICFMQIDPATLSKKDAYFFAISLITPRPIAFVTSENENGTINAAPFSYFNGIHSDPPLFMISIAMKGDKPKDTVLNLKRNPEFCVNFINEKMAEGITISAAEFPYNESEMKYNGFSLQPSDKVSVPRIKQAPAAMECRVERIIDDLGPFHLVIGRTISYYVDDELIDPETGYVIEEKAALIGRLGGADFSLPGRTLTVGRKNWKEYSELTPEVKN